MITDIPFPLDPNALLTVLGMALLSGLVSQWLKAYLPDWRWTNVMVLVVAEVLAVITQLVYTNFHPTAVAIWSACLVAFFGASVATFGYETIINLLGTMGVGRRSDTALLSAAKAKVPDKECSCSGNCL